MFVVEDNDPGQAPINNQGQANHTDAIGLALGQAIVGSGMYLKSVKTPVGYTLVYHGDGQVTTVPLVPYTKLPNDADFAMVYPSGQDIIEINVTRFDAAYSRYSNPRCASKRLSRHHLTEWRVGPTQIFLAISCRFRHK